MLDTTQSEEDAAFLPLVCLITFYFSLQNQLKLSPKFSENTNTTVKNKNTLLLTSLAFLCLAEYSQLQQEKKGKSSFQVSFARFRMRMMFIASSGSLCYPQVGSSGRLRLSSSSQVEDAWLPSIGL